MYAKLVNNSLRRPPKKVTHGDRTIFNPPDSVLAELGYYPVTYTDMPTDAPSGQHYESSWTQGETEILQVYTLVDDPAEPVQETTMADLEAAIERGLTT